MANRPSDFVQVQLSSDGIAAAGGATGSLRIVATHIDYTFKPGQPVRVLSSEWTRLLSQETIKGKKIFELAATAQDQASLAALKTQEAALEQQIASQEGK